MNRFGHLEDLPNDVQQILIGSILGDGCINRPRNCRNARFLESHSIAQADYLRWKAERIILYFGGKIWSSATHIEFCSHVHPILTELYESWWPNGKKTIPQQDIEKLDELGLAIFYQDDGTYDYRDLVCKLALCDFGGCEHTIQNWLKQRWGLNSHVYSSSRSKNSPIIYFHKKDSDKFLRLISKHVHPCMIHKLGHLHPANRAKIEEQRARRLKYDRPRCRRYHWKNRDKILQRQRERHKKIVEGRER